MLMNVNELERFQLGAKFRNVAQNRRRLIDLACAVQAWVWKMSVFEQTMCRPTPPVLNLLLQEIIDLILHAVWLRLVKHFLHGIFMQTWGQKKI